MRTIESIIKKATIDNGNGVLYLLHSPVEVFIEPNEPFCVDSGVPSTEVNGKIYSVFEYGFRALEILRVSLEHDNIKLIMINTLNERVVISAGGKIAGLELEDLRI